MIKRYQRRPKSHKGNGPANSANALEGTCGRAAVAKLNFFSLVRYDCLHSILAFCHCQISNFAYYCLREAYCNSKSNLTNSLNPYF